MKEKKILKITITALAILLAVSLFLLGAALFFKNKEKQNESVATIKDNFILQKDESSDTQKSNSEDFLNGDSAQSASNSQFKNTTLLELYDKQPKDNTAFQIGNMFPGDSQTNYYRVRVSYSGKITVGYKATVKKGYEKLGEALKIRIKLINSGEILYDGYIREMPESLTYTSVSFNKTVDELNYEITAYLDTSVGNEYQNKTLIADFNWWAEETENLESSPKTGISADFLPFVIISLAAGLIFVFLLLARGRGKEKENG